MAPLSLPLPPQQENGSFMSKGGGAATGMGESRPTTCNGTSTVLKPQAASGCQTEPDVQVKHRPEGKKSEGGEKRRDCSPPGQPLPGVSPGHKCLPSELCYLCPCWAVCFSSLWPWLSCAASADLAVAAWGLSALPLPQEITGSNGGPPPRPPWALTHPCPETPALTTARRQAASFLACQLLLRIEEHLNLSRFLAPVRQLGRGRKPLSSRKGNSRPRKQRSGKCQSSH